MHFNANVKGDTSNQPLKHYMQVFAPIYSHRSILVKICDRRSISLLLHPGYWAHGDNFNRFANQGIGNLSNDIVNM